MARQRRTEVEAYSYINSELKKLGWDTRSPSNGGQVYTQNQCLDDPEIKNLLDKKRPENIIKVNETALWVIEAKSRRTEIDTALDEAENYYAQRINKSNIYISKFISGVAGNDEDGYVIKNKFLENGEFKTVQLNEREMTGLLSPEIVRRVLENASAALIDVPVDLEYFMDKANEINKILHMGAININDRARVMAALLLATMQGDMPDLNTSPTVLINDINTRAESVLSANDKEEFFEYVRLALPTSKDNHKKYKKALVDTLKVLYSLNIKSAMNSGTDVLGQFYEVFLKYGNWAQKMGIVLTPRHVTRFAAEVVDVNLQDYVLDLVCGTGGFLVSAFDLVKSSANKAQIDQFKKNNLFGIDQQPQLACLAIVNMIFRGDGRNNIIEGDCFTKWLKKVVRDGITTAKYKSNQPSSEDNIITKVLMNPPFAIDKRDVPEYKFVQHALDQMVDNSGILFSILPMGAMFEQGEEKEWRKNKFLNENTLLAVITLPPELFVPSAGVHTLCIIAKKGVPHPKEQNVLWARAIHDGHVTIKRKRLPDKTETNDLETLLPIVKAFVHNPKFQVESVPEFYKATPIDYTDPLLELVAEAYIDSKPIMPGEIQEGMERLVRENVAFIVRFNQRDDA